MKVFSGKVIKTSDKTAKVEVERVFAHKLYAKRIKRTKRFLVHDTVGAKVGDTVRFVATRPISKLKKWKVIEIVGQETKKDKKKATVKKNKNVKTKK